MQQYRSTALQKYSFTEVHNMAHELNTNDLQSIINTAYESKNPLYVRILKTYCDRLNHHDNKEEAEYIADTLFNLMWTMNALGVVNKHQSDPIRKYGTFLHGLIVSSDLHYLPFSNTIFIEEKHFIDMEYTCPTQTVLYKSLDFYNEKLKPVLNKIYNDNTYDFLEKVQEEYINPLREQNHDPQKHDEIYRFPSIPLFYQGQLGRVILSRYQVSRIIACLMTQLTKDHRMVDFPTFPKISFSPLYDHIQNGDNGPAEIQKFRCIYEGYMKRWLDGEFDSDPIHKEYIIYSRHHCANPPNEDGWSHLNLPMSTVTLTTNTSIEDDHDAIQVDFANKRIGGGVLSGGNVQEEIRFAIEPECIASMVFFENMNDNECITITGTKPYCKYTGYGKTFQYKENIKDIGSQQVSHITAIDAYDYRSVVDKTQITQRQLRIYQCKTHFLRDLNKAYIGFQPTHYEHENKTTIRRDDLLKGPFPLSVPTAAVPHSNPPDGRAIATGHWGCGAFLGNVEIKAIQQWMAATLAGRPLHYHIWDFSDTNYPHSNGSNSSLFRDAFQTIIDLAVINNWTVSTLFRLVKRYGTYLEDENKQDRTLFTFLSGREFQR